MWAIAACVSSRIPLTLIVCFTESRLIWRSATCAKMADGDWSVALRVFRASLPRRGDKGRDDRLFLEALHYFSVHNITWRTLPERFGKRNSVWKRFDRLNKAGVFEAFFNHRALLSSSAHLVQMFDSTIVRAHISAAGAKGGRTARRSAARAAASPPRST